ncbi:MAG: PKD domain-containing protein [Steroidobacteraceae bacterium]|nr:PKD domain-containing protein [Steroidobacteraceae bacterium]
MKPGNVAFCIAAIATAGLLLTACGGGGGGNKPPANRAPIASFTITPDSGLLPLTVSLDASASRDTDGTIASFQWDFGDGVTATGVAVQHTFVESARYQVRLSVTDDDGAVGTTVRDAVSMSPVAAGSYLVTEIPALGGPFIDPRAINNKGEVAGYADINANQDEHAFLYSAGATRDLGALDGSSSGAWDINDSTEVTGTYVNAQGQERCFLYRNGSMQPLGTLGGTFCNAKAINAGGTVVGQSSNLGGDSLCFTYSGGQMSAMPTLGSPYCDANGISDNGHVAGLSITAAGDWHAYVFRNGTMTDIGGSIAGNGIRVDGINDDDDVVGMWVYGGYAGYTGFLYRAAVMGPLAGGYTEPLGVNNAGVVAGYAIFGVDGHAFIWDQTNGLQDLNDLIDPTLDLTLGVVEGINDIGQMTGFGTRADGSPVAFVLTPVW